MKMADINIDGIDSALDQLSTYLQRSVAQFNQVNLGLSENTEVKMSSYELDRQSSTVSRVVFVPGNVSLNLNIQTDIFSKLPSILFEDMTNNQIGSVMRAFRSKYIEQINRIDITSLPKLDYIEGEDGSKMIQMTSSWDSGNALLYFSFEDDPNSSSFGMIWNDDKGKNYQTRTGNLVLNNIDSVIQEVVDFIIRVFG